MQIDIFALALPSAVFIIIHAYHFQILDDIDIKKRQLDVSQGQSLAGNGTLAVFADLFEDAVLAESVVAFVGKGVEDDLVANEANVPLGQVLVFEDFEGVVAIALEEAFFGFGHL